MSIGAWNVRGLNKAVTQKEVIDVIRSNNLGICAVVESHVKVLNLKNVSAKTFGQWDWVSNNNSCEAGTRIIVGWNPRLYDVMVISQSKQVIHCYVKSCDTDFCMYLSFIYAASSYMERRLLWDNLKKHSLVVKKEAWGLLGDFNVALKSSDYSEGCSKTPKGVEDFVDCLNFIEVEDLNSYGFQFTWIKTPAGNKGLLKKLDRVMVNLKFISDHPLAYAVFKPYRNSDHCPAILNIPGGKVKWNPSFRFSIFIVEKEEFLPLVKEVWDINIDGFFMFKVCQKLKILKKHCRELCNKHWGAGKRIQQLRRELEYKQHEIDLNPFDYKIREEHANILCDFNVACNDEEKLLAQRAKIKWLQEWDNNSKFFHRIVKSRGNNNRIQMVLDEDGRWVSGKAMKDKFVSHFNKFLGCKDVTELSGLNDDFFHKKLDRRVAVNMIRVVTDDEIKAAMFDIDDNRAPGPAGKIIVNIIRNCLGDIVSKNQSTFVPGRSILDNILLAQELMVGYKKKKRVPKCTIKIDIQKAYDTMDWNFLNRILQGFGFHPVMVQWIMACVSSSWFMLNFNGEDHGYFEGKRGLRQGDPLSPYLFTIVMEVFNIILGKLINDSQNFKFHSKCMALHISHLCFADDLLVFSYGNGNSARIIRDALDEFKKFSGLKVSMEKSQIYFSYVKPNMRRIILGILPFDVGRFPFKYLGVPMCVTKLFDRDCKKLIEKIKMRIFNWKCKTLSFAGRLQLINFVLTSIHVYWASIFKIPIATIIEIEKMCRSFLWVNGEIVKGKAKVNWHDICKPKEYGGPGVKNLRKWNDALLAKHVWNVISSKNSLWVQWVRVNYIGNRNFWDILQKKSMSWTWKRFLEMRKTVRPHIVSCVGNGRNTSLWHDWWHPLGILYSIISRREWVSNGFSDSSLVIDVLDYDTYTWPVEWVNKFPGLKDAPMFCIDHNLRDVAGWRDKKEFGGISAVSCVAHIWKERNSRLFSFRRNSVEGVIACIENEIRLKLLGLRKRAKMWRKLNGGDLLAGIRWGYLWNKCLYKGIDGICYWLESLLSNHKGGAADGVGQ
ncbi:uncharacterized protein LOC111889210 [Lactuca sativa]|uniref:uncharacterized protein LOC111889210 n=1 Tax=Lactuca sativa TaxID=4236 RepID=UPI0022AE9795|nr:uncharacterized protein LOC111889210 [Lactuca sativa]